MPIPSPTVEYSFTLTYRITDRESGAMILCHSVGSGGNVEVETCYYSGNEWYIPDSRGSITETISGETITCTAKFYKEDYATVKVCFLPPPAVMAETTPERLNPTITWVAPSEKEVA